MRIKGKSDYGLPRWLWLFAGMVIFYFVPSLVLELSYGSSYNFMSLTNHWEPDGSGGWKAVGVPEQRRPSEPSVSIPFFIRIVPYVLPMLLLVLYLAGPLSQFVEKEADYKPTKYNPEEYRPDFVEEMPELEDEKDNLK